MDTSILERLAYAIARGWFRAYFDVQAEQQKAVEESATALDRERTERFRDKLRTQEAGRHPRPDSDTQGG